MSDSLPPTDGPDPYDGWDLEGLLSGESVWLPDGMRPVAATLAALRGAPTRSELAGEASARASFRQVMLAGAGEPGRPGRGGGESTLILPAGTADAGWRPVARPRHAHRRPPRRMRWQPGTLAGVAAAAVAMVVGGIALAGGFPGAGGHAGRPGQSTSAASATTSASGASAGPGLEGTATKQPTPHPSHSASGQQSPGSDSGSWRGMMCRQYWAFFAHPESPASWAAEKASLHELSKLAGSPWSVNRYCMPYYQWGFAPPAPGADPGSDQHGPGSQGPGDSRAHNLPASFPGGGNSVNNGGNGNSGNGNGKGNGNSGNGNGDSSHADISHQGGGNQR